jgi:hypothetical protein
LSDSGSREDLAFECEDSLNVGRNKALNLSLGSKHKFLHFTKDLKRKREGNISRSTSLDLVR